MIFDNKIYKIADGKNFEIIDTNIGDESEQEDSNNNLNENSSENFDRLYVFVLSEKLRQKQLILDGNPKCIAVKENIDADYVMHFDGNLIVKISGETMSVIKISDLQTKEDIEDEKQE